MPDQADIEYKERTPLRVDKLHFLIHPGFITDPAVMEMGVSPEGPALLEKYVEQAQKLRENELMLVFPHTDFGELRSDLAEGKIYAKTLKKIKEILGRRMVLVSADFDVFESPRVFQRSLSIIKGRGYDFTPDAETFAYGETLGLCVPDGAENLNKSGGFNKKTSIIPELTDGNNDEKVYAAVRARLKTDKSYPHVSFGNL
jgi:hypothetical protein